MSCAKLTSGHRNLNSPSRGPAGSWLGSRDQDEAQFFVFFLRISKGNKCANV